MENDTAGKAAEAAAFSAAVAPPDNGLVSTAVRNYIQAFELKYEASIPHMYRDKGGVITVGVGHALPYLTRAFALPFQAKAGTLGLTWPIEDLIRMDWNSTLKMQPGLTADKYALQCLCELHVDNINSLLMLDIDIRLSSLNRYFTEFHAWPEPAQVGIFDMVWNLGLSKLSKEYLRLQEGLVAQDWGKVASESGRNGISAERNKATAALFLAAAAGKTLEEAIAPVAPAPPSASPA
jgi:GH24 family phage-related lysozyme (muramidase)